MKLIIISGPSGSGKTTLSKIILNEFSDGLALNTDNYYRTGILSKLLSKLIDCYFDRKISFNYKLFKKDFDFASKYEKLNHSYIYDFKTKTINKYIKETTNIKYLIIEGIFTNVLLKDLRKQKFLHLELKTDKESCLKRILYRDIRERGKTENKARRQFLKSWNLYYRKNKKFYKKFSTYQTIYEDKEDIDLILKRISNLIN